MTLDPDGTARIGDHPVGRAVWTDRDRRRLAQQLGFRLLAQQMEKAL